MHPTRTLCLGEALVDLICERQLDGGLAAADAFVPHFGGAVANVAMVAADAGAHVALAGGAGQDPWGRWLRSRLEATGVDLSLFTLLPGSKTPVAIVTVDAAGEATYQIYGEEIATVVHALEDTLESAVQDSAALFISSNTLVGEREREITMRARSLALEQGRHVIFDPNLRLHRWRSRTAAAAAANACVPGSLLVRANLAEAVLMTGERDPDRAALSLVKTGAHMAVVTLGSRGAILRGAIRADASGVPAAVLSTIGAGDVMTGMLLASLAKTDFYPSAAAAWLRDAVAGAAAACERWGALE